MRVMNKGRMSGYMSEKRPPVGCLSGKFLKENKNRFRCMVEIDGVETLCYIASSCRLDNFVSLTGKEVLLKPTTGRGVNAKYTVCGLKYKRSYILLNTSFANRAVENSIKSRRFAFIGAREGYQREHTIDGYKTDLYLPSSKTIIEVKSVISTAEQAQFGTVHSDRFLRQLADIEELIEAGYNARLFIISLNPYTKAIELPSGNALACAIDRCKTIGLQINAFTCRIAADGEVFIHQQIPIYE